MSSSFSKSAAALSLLAGLGMAPAWAARLAPNTAGDEVTDSQTHLVWRRCDEGQNWAGGSCAGTSLSTDWAGAGQRAVDEAKRTGVAWRLPTVDELKTLVVPRAVPDAATIDGAVFPNTSAEWHWSGTPVTGDATGALGVDFYDGSSRDAARSDKGWVRLVRSAP